MQYNGDLKNIVISKFNSAINQINSCKSVHIDIPSDFEGSGTINSALSKIKAANLGSIKGEFERVANEAEATEAKALQHAFGFEFMNNVLSFSNKGNQKDNYDVYHQIKDNKNINTKGPIIKDNKKRMLRLQLHIENTRLYQLRIK